MRVTGLINGFSYCNACADILLINRPLILLICYRSQITKLVTRCERMFRAFYVHGRCVFYIRFNKLSWVAVVSWAELTLRDHWYISDLEYLVIECLQKQSILVVNVTLVANTPRPGWIEFLKSPLVQI